MEKDLISGTSARAEYKIKQVNSTLYEKLNKKETSALNELIMIRRERSLKKHHDAEAIKINKAAEDIGVKSPVDLSAVSKKAKDFQKVVAFLDKGNIS